MPHEGQLMYIATSSKSLQLDPKFSKIFVQEAVVSESKLIAVVPQHISFIAIKDATNEYNLYSANKLSHLTPGVVQLDSLGSPDARLYSNQKHSLKFFVESAVLSLFFLQTYGIYLRITTKLRKGVARCHYNFETYSWEMSFMDKRITIPYREHLSKLEPIATAWQQLINDNQSLD